MAAVFTDDTFDAEVLKAQGLVLVDFFAEWCGPCKMMAPVIDELAKERTDVKIGKLNVEEAQSTAGQFGVASIPTIIFFKGGKEIDRMVGFQSKDALEEKLEGLV